MSFDAIQTLGFQIEVCVVSEDLTVLIPRLYHPVTYIDEPLLHKRVISQKLK